MTPNVRLCLTGLVLITFFCGSEITYGQNLSTGELYAEIGFNFYSGDYGTDTDTDTFTVPFIFGYAFNNKWDVSLTIPYIYQSTSATVTIAGTPIPVKKNRTGGKSNISEQYIDTTSQSGIGDIFLDGSYKAVEETSGEPALYILAGIKLPTADEDKGLGTGEDDYYLGLGLEKNKEKWTFSGDIQYNIIGSPSGIDLDNFFSITVGASHQCTASFNGSIDIYAAQSASDESHSPLEITIGGEYSIDGDNTASLYLLKGLSDGSPDYGLGIALSRYF